MDINWPPILMGTVMVIVGGLIIKFQKPLISFIVEAQGVMFGQRVGRFYADRAKPWALLPVGVFAMGLGVVIVLMGLFMPREMF